MSISPTTEDLEQRFGEWSTEALIEAVKLKSDEYIPMAIEVMRRLLDSRGLPEAELLSVQSNLVKEEEDEATRLSRVRGWLAFFTVVVVLSSLSQLLAAANLALAETTATLSLTALLLGATGIYGGYVTLLLTTKQTRAPMHAERWIVLNVISSLVSAALLHLARGTALPSPLGAGLFAGIWLAYFDYSKRVVSVYGVFQ